MLIGKYRRRFAGFDDKIIALYARGMTTREIAAHLRELYGVEISPDLVSAVTDAVLEEVAAWQSRRLEAPYAIVFFDAIRVKIRNEGMVNNKAVYLAIGVRLGPQENPRTVDRADRRREVLAAGDDRTAQPRDPGHPDRRGRRAQGFSRGDQPRCFRKTVVQTCIVHLIRYSMHFASWKERRPVAAALKPIYQASIGRGGARAAGRFRPRPLGPKISGHRAKLAAQLGAGDTVLRLRA